MMEHGTIMLPVVGKSNVLGNAFAFSGSSRHAAPKLLNQHRSAANCVGDSFGRPWLWESRMRDLMRDKR